jgi:hypothetical protein
MDRLSSITLYASQSCEAWGRRWSRGDAISVTLEHDWNLEHDLGTGPWGFQCLCGCGFSVEVLESVAQYIEGFAPTPQERYRWVPLYESPALLLAQEEDRILREQEEARLRLIEER